MHLVAGTVDKYRNAEILDHFLYLRCMKNHRRFNCHITVLIDEHLIVRLAVFSRKLHRAFLDRILCLLDVPSGSVDTGHLDTVQRIQRPKECHRRACRQVNPVQRLLQHDHIRCQTVRCLLPVRNEQILRTVMDIDQCIIIFIIIYVKTGRIVKLQLTGTLQPLDIRRILCRRHPGGICIRGSCIFFCLPL